MKHNHHTFVPWYGNIVRINTLRRKFCFRIFKYAKLADNLAYKKIYNINARKVIVHFLNLAYLKASNYMRILVIHFMTYSFICFENHSYVLVLGSLYICWISHPLKYK